MAVKMSCLVLRSLMFEEGRQKLLVQSVESCERRIRMQICSLRSVEGRTSILWGELPSLAAFFELRGWRSLSLIAGTSGGRRSWQIVMKCSKEVDDTTDSGRDINIY